ncbi:relaxase/mobilization nuclease domain-containing protein [[Ruminococcus] torques]|uniref:relaxase/mobilization nuclease domain-containing protein n=1 Tax=[Ruminococcus] torques TaxID=33039 RepID=UPI00352073A5
MAVTKLLNMKEKRGGKKSGHLKNAIAYILNEKKTAKGLYMNSNCGCDAEEIYRSMMETKDQWGKEWGRQGYHFIISFLPGEATEETAYRTAARFVELYLKDQYDYVYAVHNDKGHMHAHIIFNSVSHGGYKYHYGNGQWEKDIQPIVDRLCREQGLSTILLNENGKGRSYGEWLAEKEGKMTWREALRMELDAAVRVCSSYEELLTWLKNNGYGIREGNSREHGAYLSIHPPGSRKAFRTYTLGKDYEVSQLKKRVGINLGLPDRPRPPKIKICRLPYGKKGYRAASVYQLNQVGRYYRVKHFYNYQGQQYRKDIFRIREMYLQCCCLFRNNIHSQKELDERIAEMVFREKELKRYQRELSQAAGKGQDTGKQEPDMQAVNAKLRELRAEKRLLRGIRMGEDGSCMKILKDQISLPEKN